MDELIEALTILGKYMSAQKRKYPTHCEHDVLMVCHVPHQAVSDEDEARLKVLGFDWDEQYDCWSSFRFGSC